MSKFAVKVVQIELEYSGQLFDAVLALAKFHKGTNEGMADLVQAYEQAGHDRPSNTTGCEYLRKINKYYLKFKTWPASYRKAVERLNKGKKKGNSLKVLSELISLAKVVMRSPVAVRRQFLTDVRELVASYVVE